MYNAISPQSLLISRIRERNVIKREREEEEEGIERGAANLAQGEWHTTTFLRTTRIGERERESRRWLAGSGVEREGVGQWGGERGLKSYMPSVTFLVFLVFLVF